MTQEDPIPPKGKIIDEYQAMGRTLYIDQVTKGTYILIKTTDLWYLAKVSEKESQKTQSVRIPVVGKVFPVKEDGEGLSEINFVEVAWPLADVEYQYLPIQ